MIDANLQISIALKFRKPVQTQKRWKRSIYSNRTVAYSSNKIILYTATYSEHSQPRVYNSKMAFTCSYICTYIWPLSKK